MVNELASVSTPEEQRWMPQRRGKFGVDLDTHNWKFDGFDIAVNHTPGYRPIIELVRFKSATPDIKPSAINPEDIVWSDPNMDFLFVNNSSHGLSKVLKEHGLPRLPREFHRTVVEASTAYRYLQCHTWQRFGTSI